MLEQQQMRWALNNKIEELSNKVNNLLKNEKYGVCQNINKFISGINSCNSSDVAKCESYLNTVNHTLNSASDLRSSIDNKRKELFLEDHTLTSFAGDELAYLEAQRRITTLHEELQLTTAHINLSKKFPLCTKKSSTSRRKKENKRKVRKTKEKRLEQRARQLLGNLTSIEVADKFSVQLKRMKGFPL